MKILFIGCVESSYILLKKLIEINAEIVGVITKKESGYNADFTDLAPLCRKHNIKYLYVRNINDPESIEFARNCEPHMAFCFGWSQLIKDEFLQMIPNGVVGFHPAKLPYNRGRHPIIWALALGLKETASTFFMIDREADTGDIVSQSTICIEYEDDAHSLYVKIMKEAENQVSELWSQIVGNTVNRVKQKQGEGNAWRKRSKIDGEIDWRMSSRNIYNLVRSLTRPYPGAYFKYKEKEISVWKVEEIISKEHTNIEPGKILSVNENGWVDIKTGDNIIRIIESDQIYLKEGEYL